MRRMIIRIINWWQRRQMERAVPGLATINRAIADRRARHLSTAALVKARREIVNQQLKKEAAACRRT